MSYSIIITYRDRESHLQTLLPRLATLFKNEDYEIIVAEQADQGKFKQSFLNNIAATSATKDLLVFHDVDYYPTDNVSYHTTKDKPLYPVRQVIFLDEDNQPLPLEKVPAGYRYFHQDVRNHSGGVFVLSKEIFNHIGGFNPLYSGWGKEDEDTRERIKMAGYTWTRGDQGLFYALYHKPIHIPDNDPDWINNNVVYQNYTQHLSIGSANCKADVDEYASDGNIRWLKISNMQVK